ncbi:MULTISPECIES: hypothetical protein [Metabacillus]|jgi:hypothetical protein|uniref:Uncharacterized protein n=1 Tax=Metabacillus rhizosphaerae TaxID=3117747 RepID=A0ABZ2MYN5_9BACI|nr:MULTISPECIES: hypothetical protein [Metabacillus]
MKVFVIKLQGEISIRNFSTVIRLKKRGIVRETHSIPRLEKVE